MNLPFFENIANVPVNLKPQEYPAGIPWDTDWGLTDHSKDSDRGLTDHNGNSDRGLTGHTRDSDRGLTDHIKGFWQGLTDHIKGFWQGSDWPYQGILKGVWLTKEIAIHLEILRETTSDGSIHNNSYTQGFNMF